MLDFGYISTHVHPLCAEVPGKCCFTILISAAYCGDSCTEMIIISAWK